MEPTVTQVRRGDPDETEFSLLVLASCTMYLYFYLYYHFCILAQCTISWSLIQAPACFFDSSRLRACVNYIVFFKSPNPKMHTYNVALYAELSSATDPKIS